MARKIAVEIVGDSRSLERAFARSARGAKQFNSDIDRAGKKSSVFSGVGKAASFAAGALGIGGLASAAQASFDELKDSQNVAAQTAAALKSTHGAANVTAEQIDRMGTSLMNLSGVDDEAIKSSANLMLAFTNVRNEAGKGNDVFNQANLAALNLSTRLGKDLPSSAKLVGKALNDPVKGMTALRRVGISFTAQQQKQIKAMVASGHTMDAQKVILRALQERFGGAARAAGDTMGGKINKLKENLRNLGGQIAGQLAPTITHLVTQITNWISKSENQKKVMDIVRSAVSALKTAVGILSGAFRLLSRLVGGNTNAIKVLIGAYAAWKIGKIVGAIATLVGSFGTLTAAEGTATVATEGLTFALGPAGLVAAAAAAGYALGTLIYQIPIVKKLADEATNSIASLFGYTNPMDKYRSGNPLNTQAEYQLVRKLSAQGLTAPQIAQRTGLNVTDVRNAVSAYNTGATYGMRAPIVVHNMQVNAPRTWTDELHRLQRGRPHSRR